MASHPIESCSNTAKAIQAENVLSLSKDTSSNMFHLYILQNKTGKLYVGISKNPVRRTKEHNAGKGVKYTADNHNFKLVYTEPYEILSQAVQREKQLKGWTRAKKQALVNGNKSLLTRLSKSKR